MLLLSPLETDLILTSQDSENDESDNDYEELDSLDVKMINCSSVNYWIIKTKIVE